MEKFCPACGTVYPEDGDATHCDNDGEKLVVLQNEPDLVGRNLEGKYLIRELIGEGGMGTVYLAYQASVDREVAIKVLRPQYSRNKLAIKRFHREAKAASRLAHPNTITVYDSGQTDDHLLYQVIELLNGQPLSDILDDEGPMEPLRAINIVSQICDSLAEAHASGITHRDLKPENIFIEPKYGNPEFVKVLDFGIAKISDSNVTQATATGMICGTPSYMSPEQAMGRDLDGRSDIYSLGVLLFEMLSGERPFEGDSPMEVMLKHINGDTPPLPDGAGGIHAEGLNEALAWMLAKKPDDRPDDCQILKARLRAVIEGVGTTTPAAIPAPPRKKGARREVDHSEPTVIGTPARNQTDDPSLEKTGLSPAVSPDLANWAGTTQETPRWIVAVAALLFLAIGGGAGWYFLAGPGVAAESTEVAEAEDGDSSEVAADTAQVEAATAAGAGSEGEAPSGDAAPPAPVEAAPVEATTVTLTINSAPTGASVVDSDGKVLGTTPMSLSRSADTGPFSLTLKLEGHLDALLDVDPSKGTQWTTDLALVPAPVEAAPTASKKKATRKKTTAKKTTARKTTAKKTPAKKTPAEQSGDKKSTSGGKKKSGDGYDDGGKRGFGTF